VDTGILKSIFYRRRIGEIQRSSLITQEVVDKFL